MKMKLAHIVFLWSMVTYPCMAQVIPKNQVAVEAFNSLPKEQLFIHGNSSLLFPAEYLYYRVYCLNDQSKELSQISKIAYVELINRKLEVIFKHKIWLHDGVGQGDYFVPADLPSGNYKLVAYTNWMRNFNNEGFFESDLNIINPYQADQNAILNSSLFLPANDSAPIQEKSSLDLPLTKLENAPQIKLNKECYKKREKVLVKIRVDSLGEISSGKYSLSVRKQDYNLEYNDTDTKKKLSNTNNGESNNGQGYFYLPEIRGELLSGKVIPLKDGVPVSFQKVAVSFPGTDSDFKIVQTNRQGQFFVQMARANFENKILVQILGNNRDQLKIEMDDPKSPSYRHMIFNQFYINKAMQPYILNRSVHNQIESAYYSLKPDSVVSNPKKHHFLEKNAKTYLLSDYTRFKSVKEAIIEIIKDVGLRKNNKGEVEIEVKSIDLISDRRLLPLVLVDGVIEQNHNRILDFDARKVKSISVWRDKYVFGPSIFQGVVEITTKKSDYISSSLKSPIHEFDYLQPQLNKKYFTQTHKKQDLKGSFNLPDDRLQLLWKPDFKLKGEESILEFYTSDVTGIFEINIKGYTGKGRPVILNKAFEVE